MNNACKLEFTWWKWPSDPLEVSKKYFSSVEAALEFCDHELNCHKDWRIIQNGAIIQTMMGRILKLNCYPLILETPTRRK